MGHRFPSALEIVISKSFKGVLQAELAFEVLLFSAGASAEANLGAMRHSNAESKTIAAAWRL